MPDKPIRQDLLDELARLFADEVRATLKRRAEEAAARLQAESTPANVHNDPR